MNIQYIYLLKEREFIKTNEPILKIGMTAQLNNDRFKQYPKGSILLFQMICLDCKQNEKQIIALFKNKYKHRKDIGNEYFEGDFVTMIDDIYLILHKENNKKEEMKEEIKEEMKEEIILKKAKQKEQQQRYDAKRYSKIKDAKLISSKIQYQEKTKPKLLEEKKRLEQIICENIDIVESN